jgi:hypothetical protein
MKTCVIEGDLSSDSAADQYPTVPVCDDCVETDDKAGANHIIVSKGEYDDSFGDTCEICGTTAEEEEEAKAG